MKRPLTGLVLAAGLTLSATAMPQETAPDRRIRERLSGRLSEAIAAIVDSAKRVNIPTEPLIDRAFEGLTKGASEAKIIAAVSRMAQDLGRARRALGPGFSDEEIHAAMIAIKAGVDVKQLERLRAARSGQKIAIAINVIGTLAKDVNPDTAANVIIGLVNASATDDQLLALESEIGRDIAAGAPATSAMSVRGQQLTQVIATANANGGVPGSTLPSGLGSTQGGGPAANASLGGGGAAGNNTTGGSKPAPAGKKPTPKKP